MTQTALIADIGGTNTRLALATSGAISSATIRRFRNASYNNFAQVVTGYLPEVGTPTLCGACVAVAGPVRGGVAKLTNIDWSLDITTIAKASGIDRKKVALLNDLQAPGHAIGHIAPENLTELITTATSPNTEASALVVNVGTGFNAVPVHTTPAGRCVPASESGHVNLPIRSAEDLHLSQALSDGHGFPAVEEVLSGRGLEKLYRFYCAESHVIPSLQGADIITAAKTRTSPEATAAIETFLRFLGSVAGNLALIHLPFGGIYLVGGVAVGLAHFLEQPGFAEAFRDKGRFSSLMSCFSITLVQDDYAALIGCAKHLHERQN